MTQPQIIEFYTRNVYGVEHRYIVNEELSNTIQTLTGRKTILKSDMRALEKLGFVFIEVLAPKK